MTWRRITKNAPKAKRSLMLLTPAFIQRCWDMHGDAARFVLQDIVASGNGRIECVYSKEFTDEVCKRAEADQL
jgi:hypothetical protein